MYDYAADSVVEGIKTYYKMEGACEKDAHCVVVCMGFSERLIINFYMRIFFLYLVFSDLMKGYNGTILTYGQTGSGKVKFRFCMFHHPLYAPFNSAF